MPHIITQTDGVYLDVNGQLVRIENAVAAFSKQAPNDLIIYVAKKDVREDAPIDAKTAYNYLDADIRRMAVAAGVITQGEANQMGRVATNEPARGDGGGSVA